MQIKFLTQASAGRGVVVIVGTLGMVEYRQIVPLEEAREWYRRLGDAILDAGRIDQALAAPAHPPPPNCRHCAHLPSRPPNCDNPHGQGVCMRAASVVVGARP